MRIWCITNQKGGVGKTTTAVALAGLLAARGKRVVALDLDPHASLSHWLLGDAAPARGSHELFLEPAAPIAELARPCAAEGLMVVPARGELAAIERQGASRPGLGMALSRALEAAASDYDYALLDTLPAMGLVMVSALAAADLVVAPTLTEPLALHGLEGLCRTVEMIARSRHAGKRLRIVPTLYDRRTRAAQDSLAALRQRHGERAWAEEVPVDARLREASRSGRPPDLFDRGARGSQAYARLLEWLLAADAAPLELAA